MSADARAAAIVQSTIGLAHSLGMILVAEGVEDEETALQLARSGVTRPRGTTSPKHCRPSRSTRGWTAALRYAGQPDHVRGYRGRPVTATPWVNSWTQTEPTRFDFTSAEVIDDEQSLRALHPSSAAGHPGVDCQPRRPTPGFLLTHSRATTCTSGASQLATLIGICLVPWSSSTPMSTASWSPISRVQTKAIAGC